MAEEPVIEVTIPALLRAARTAYGTAMRAALAKAGFGDIPKNGIFVIGALNRTGAPLADIIRMLRTSKQSAGQLVDALVERGYLERAIDEEDRRRVTVRLSQRGRAAAEISRDANNRVTQALVEKAGPDCVTQMRKGLAALVELSWERKSE
ncbi:MAG TPA: MarR family transcriptional regulator [Rhizomicrobium sp.]|nr:MarR family transcriptional regulator [Rhizomicrobium sp.]